MEILKTFRKHRLLARGSHLTGLVAGIVAVAMLAALTVGPFDAPAESKDLCSEPIAPQSPPNIAMSTPDYDPSKDPLPTLPAGAVELPAFDPDEPETRPALPSGWTWDGNEPRPVGQGGTVLTDKSPDGKLFFTLLPADVVISWDDPDRPEGLPWYDPTIEDPCR